MQTYAEKYMIEKIVGRLKLSEDSLILNVGSGSSVVIENHLDNFGCSYISDRVDIENCRVKHVKAGKCHNQSVETMGLVDSDKYNLAFSNFVLEHVRNVDMASREIFRVLKKRGYFIFTVPNPLAPEFLFSRLTNVGVHKKVKGVEKCWPTFYNYKNIYNLVGMFEAAGFKTEEVKFFPAVFTYFYKYPILNILAKAYDIIVGRLGFRILQGHVCLSFKKL